MESSDVETMMDERCLLGKFPIFFPQEKMLEGRYYVYALDSDKYEGPFDTIKDAAGYLGKLGASKFGFHLVAELELEYHKLNHRKKPPIVNEKKPSASNESEVPRKKHQPEKPV